MSERSERALRKTRILAMDPPKLLQTATSTTKLTHSIRLARSPPSYFFLLRNHEKYQIKECPILIPRPLFVDYCTATNQSVILLQRITDTLGSQRDRNIRLDYAKAMVSGMARYHAYYWPINGKWQHEESKRLSGAINPVFQIVSVKLKLLMGTTLKLLKEQNGYVIDKQYAKRIKKTLSEGLMRMLVWMDNSPFQTINHGDPRLDNWFFKEKKGENGEVDEVEGGLYDFALAVRSPCYYDVSWMLSHSWPNDFTNDHEEEFLSLYWDTLKANLPKECKNSQTLLFGDFRTGYALGQLVCFAKCNIACEALAKMDKNGSEYKEKIRICMNGTQGCLEIIQRMNVMDMFDDMLDGNLPHSSVKNRRRTVANAAGHRRSSEILANEEAQGSPPMSGRTNSVLAHISEVRPSDTGTGAKGSGATVHPVDDN